MKRINRIKLFLAVFLFLFLWHVPVLAAQGVDAKISQQTYKTGDQIVVTGKIPAGEDLYLSIASEREFAPEEAGGVNELKTFKDAVRENSFEMDTSVPVFYYMLTNQPGKFGDVVKKRFGGPSFIKGIYSTTMFKLAEWEAIDPQIKKYLAPLDSKAEWDFFKLILNTAIRKSIEKTI